MERKKTGQIQGRISWRRLVRNPTIQYIIINRHTKYEYSSLHSFTEIFDEKFLHSKYGKKENWTNTGKNKQEKAGSQSHDTSLSTCIPIMNILSCTVSQKSLTKNFIIQSMERKKIGQIKGRIGRRRLVCNPTIQHVIINLYTKYDSSSLQGCGEIFDEKVLRKDGRKYGRNDGQM